MYLRISLVAALFSTSLAGLPQPSASADWYGIQIRSKEQAALEAAEQASQEFNVPNRDWIEDSQITAVSKPNDSGKIKPDLAVVEAEVSQAAPVEWSQTVWKPVGTLTQSRAEAVEAAVSQDLRSRVETESVKIEVSSQTIDQDVAKDVDVLLNQKEQWFAPLEGAKEVSQDLRNVAFSAETGMVDSLSYLDELRELEQKDAAWIQSSVVSVNTSIDENLNFSETPSVVQTQPMFLNELEELVARNSAVNEVVPPHLVELEELRAGHLMMVTSSASRILAQASPNDDYAPGATRDQKAEVDEAHNLFPSITALTANGKSSSELMKNSKQNTQLKHPENFATKYMAELIPGEYVMGPVVGVSAPSRYPVCFLHQPLYFEDPNLERCGVSNGYLTTVCSAGKFLGSTAALPYLLVVTPPKTCLAALGDCPTCAEFGTDAYFREWRRN